MARLAAKGLLRAMEEDRQQPASRPGGKQATPRVMASSSSVVRQAHLMNIEGTAWHAVKTGSLEVCMVVVDQRQAEAGTCALGCGFCPACRQQRRASP